MNWYKRAMPLVKDIAPIIQSVCDEIKAISGVNDVYIWGSYLEHKDTPLYPVKDIDIIAATKFNSGDLLAIDNGPYSALKTRTDELEDMGFNPIVVSFTKRFLAMEKYNVDHWAISSDNRLLHWGSITNTTEEWQEIHGDAEKRAQKDTGLSRTDLGKSSDNSRNNWKKSYDQYFKMFLNIKSLGWCLSNRKIEDVLCKAKKI